MSSEKGYITSLGIFFRKRLYIVFFGEKMKKNIFPPPQSLRPIGGPLLKKGVCFLPNFEIEPVISCEKSYVRFSFVKT